MASICSIYYKLMINEIDINKIIIHTSLDLESSIDWRFMLFLSSGFKSLAITSA